jgi:hypothetical protein
MYLTSHLTNIFQCQSQFIDTNNITQWDRRKNIQITDKAQYYPIQIFLFKESFSFKKKLTFR